MTKPEFNTWLKNYSAAFPDTAAWLNTSADKTETIGFWFQALQHTDLADAKEATRRMAVGDEPALAAYEREATARTIATIAKKVRSGKRIVRREETLPDYGGHKWSSAGTYDALRKAVSEGKSTLEILKAIPDDANPSRYRCLRCRDSGSVLVWANVTIHAVMKGAERVPKKRCSVRCTCEASRRWSEEFPMYDETKFCLFSGYGAIDEVRQWCEVYKQCKVASMAGYTPGFESGAW